MRSAYVLTFLAQTGIALSGVFIPLLARQLGLSFVELGLVGASYGVASLFSFSFFGWLSDLKKTRKRFIVAGFVVSTIAFTLQIWMQDFLSLFLIRMFAGFSIGIFNFPLLAMLSGTSRLQERVGWFSGFGSLGWFAGYLLAGLLATPSLGFRTAGLCFLIGALIAVSLKGGREKKTTPRPFWEIAHSNMPLYLSYFLRHVGAYSIWIIFPIFLQDLGASMMWIGIIHAVNTGLQFPFMGAIGRSAKEGEGKRLIRAGLILSTVVFLFYYFATAYTSLLVVQGVLALAWSSLYVGSILHLLERNVERATPTGILGSTISLATVVGPVVGGTVSQFFGLRGVFLAASGLSIASLIVSKWIK